MSDVVTSRPIQSREFMNPSGPSVMEVAYVCDNGRCFHRGEVWTIHWPVVEGMTLEQTPSCADCGYLVTKISRKKVLRNAERDVELAEDQTPVRA